MSVIGRGQKVVDRENKQRLREVKEAIRISQPPQVMSRDQSGGGACNLSNAYRPLFTTRKQSSGKQSTSRDITRSRPKSDDGFR